MRKKRHKYASEDFIIFSQKIGRRTIDLVGQIKDLDAVGRDLVYHVMVTMTNGSLWGNRPRRRY